jgi:anthranilate synthase component 2
MILIIDNYDSFTYNLYQYAGMIQPDVRVVRNDALDIPGILALAPSHVLISPGPGYPADAGISIEAARRLGTACPVLGICLGHQAIGEAFGGTITRAPGGPVHGKRGRIRVADPTCPLFEGLPGEMTVGRYHSLVVDQDTLPEALAVTARTPDGLIMGLRHKTLPVYGVQFHPESLLTAEGMRLMENFLKG